MSISDRLTRINTEEVVITEEAEYPELYSPELFSLCEELTKELSKKIASIPIWFDYSKKEQQELISAFLNTQLNEQFSEIKLTTKEIERISSSFFNSVYGFGSLDFLIANKDVVKIFVNSPSDIYVEKKRGNIEKTDTVIEQNQFSSLISWLLNASKKNSSVVTFRFNNLIITIIQEPISETKLIIQKVSESLFNFRIFEDKNILIPEISTFLRYLAESKKHILISAPAKCDKASFINAFINELDNDYRVTLFEEGGFINTNKVLVNRYDTEGLSHSEQVQLINAAMCYSPDYVFSGVSDMRFNVELSQVVENVCGLISTVRANSAEEALSLYTSVMVLELKSSEKYANRNFAKIFDYIIQLDVNDELCFLTSIYEVNKNTDGTELLTEVLNNSGGEISYNFKKTSIPEADIQISEEDIPSHYESFSARFGL